jgi:SpoVK/Ycf46/Vps4 family AAA+-type ATPase
MFHFPNTEKTGFVEYLDSIASHKIDYAKMADMLYLSRVHYMENALYDPGFCGNIKPALPLPKSFIPIPIRPSLAGNDTTQNKFELWQKAHEYDCSAKLTPLDSSIQAPSPPSKKYVEIDVSIDTLDDVLRIINENPYESDNEYNIDLKSLHNIKKELDQLNKMIGMKSLKSSILDQLVYFLQNLHLSNGESDFKHTVLYGPPGTGKTEIAKIIGTDLVAGYLGQTAIKTKNVIQDCLGGVLFIDEAYSLANSCDNDSFSKECIDTLCEALSDHKNNLMVIIAGYEHEIMDIFFKANPGMESRFMWRFKTESYNACELNHIFRKKVEDAEWKVDEQTVSDSWFEKRKDKFPHFGRDMEMLFSYAKIAHSRRIYGKPSAIRKQVAVEDMDRGYKMLLENRKKDSPISTTLLSMYI